MTQEEYELVKKRKRNHCPKCDGTMLPGFALVTVFTKGLSDFAGDPDNALRTMSPGGPGKQVKVSKCLKCGYSRT